MKIKRFNDIINEKKFEGFKEMTFTTFSENDNGEITQDEVMFDILSNGKVIDIYCYNDGIPHYYDYEKDKTVTFRTKPGKNPLFLHIAPTKNNIHKLLGYCEATPSLENENDYELVMDMLKYYGFGLNYGDNWGYDI